MSSLSCLLLIVAIANAVQGQVEICGSDKFDLKTIKKQPYWTFRVPDAKWCVGGEANINAECHASFSFCGPIPEGHCGKHNDTGFCQTVTDANIITSYDTGKSTNIVSEVEGNNGFQFAYRNGTNTSTCVNDTTATLVFFQCDPNAEWNIYDNNVTRFVESFLPNPEDPCLFVVMLNYSGACVPQKPIFPKLCQLDGYELQTLTDPLAWLARVPSKYCYGLNVPEGGCELAFSFCKELPTGQCYKSAFCQPGIPSYSFGQFNEHFKANENEGNSGFTMTYHNGTHTHNCSDGFFSTLVFTCDPNAVWTVDPTTDTTNITQFISAAEPTFNDCEYIVRFNYSGACYSGPPPTSPGSGKGKNQGQSPVGWALMGIFFGAVIIYVAVGITIQVIRGKKGIEIVPNSGFWRSVIMYILEGCKVTVDFVTCFSMRNKNLTITKKADYESL